MVTYGSLSLILVHGGAEEYEYRTGERFFL
jgi:hypothetical protein